MVLKKIFSRLKELRDLLDVEVTNIDNLQASAVVTWQADSNFSAERIWALSADNNASAACTFSAAGTALTVTNDLRVSNSAGIGVAASGTAGALTVNTWGRFGTTTYAAAQGDLAAGLTGGRQMFWDESVGRVELGNTTAATTVSYSVVSPNYRFIWEHPGDVNYFLARSADGGTFEYIRFSNAVPAVVTINEGAANMDFRIKSQTNASIFFVDASANSAGMGTNAPNSTALLDMVSTTKGFGPPSMTTTQRDNISSPRTGLLVYNNSTNKLNFYNGTAWEAVTSA